MTSSGRGTGTVGNVQAAVDAEHHLIVAHDVTNAGHDRTQLGSTPLTRTLQLSPMMGQEECHAAEKALQRGVQA